MIFNEKSETQKVSVVLEPAKINIDNFGKEEIIKMGSITLNNSETEDKIISVETKRTTAVNFVFKEPGPNYWELSNV